MARCLLQGKVLCFACLGKLASETLSTAADQTLSKKIISPAIFDTNRSFKW